MSSTEHFIELTDSFAAHNYHPLSVCIKRGSGSWLYDTEGKRYLDMLSAYSAVIFGHSNREIVNAAKEQLDILTLTSRACYSEEFALFARELAALTNKDKILAMNSGAEAVETAIKAARKWGEETKGVPKASGEIIAFTNNFHGRTVTIVSASSSEWSRTGFGPYTPGFIIIPYGDIKAFEDAMTSNTVGVLIESIQGEGGIVVPPIGYLKKVSELCKQNKTLLMCDEIQTGLCRTGKLFDSYYDDVTADIWILGKGLGGSIVPLSAIAANNDIMDVFTAGTHGSTFGGNPFASRIGRKVIEMIQRDKPETNAVKLGDYLRQCLREINSPKVKEVRGRGLLTGLEIKPEFGPAQAICDQLLKFGILCKDTRKQTMRIVPPLTISKIEIDWALERFKDCLG